MTNEQNSLRISKGTDYVLVALLLVIGVAVPLIIALKTGAARIPQLDDWVYRKTAINYFHTGVFKIYVGANGILFGQILLTAPVLYVFGIHWYSFTIFSLFFSVLGITCAYYLARQFLNKFNTFVCVSFLVIFPGLAWSTTTYMTDLPAFSLELLCLLLGLAAAKSESKRAWSYFLLSMLVGLLGFSIRQFAIAAPMSVLLYFIFENRANNIKRFLLAGAVEIMCCAGIYLWWERLSGKTNEIFFNAPLIHSIGAVFISFFTISFVLSPIIFPVYVYTSKKATKWFYISTIAALLVGLIAWRLFGLFMGTNIEQSGMVVSHLLGLRPNLFPGPIWTVFTIINLFSGAALAGISGNYLSKLQIKNISNVHMNVVSIFLVFMTLELCFLRILGVGEYDRYFWPVAFSIGLLLLSNFEKMLYLQKTVISNYFLISSLSIFYVISTIYTINSDVYSVATWKSGWQLVARGLIPSQIDAGYTWDGQFARSNMIVNPLSYDGLNQWWLDLWKNYVSCGVVANSELHIKQFELVAVHDYHLIGAGAIKHLYLYQNVNSACTPLK